MMDLWSYMVETDSRDCDGHHYDRWDFLAIETPNEVVYDRANLFALDGPSTVRLVDGATRDSGIAYVSEPTDEGGCRYTISWDRVTKAKERDEFLASYESQGPRLSYVHRYMDLYSLRLKENVQSTWEIATHVGVKVGEDDRCSLASVAVWRGGIMDPLWTPQTSGAPAFEEDVLRVVEHDLAVFHQNGGLNDGQFLRL